MKRVLFIGIGFYDYDTIIKQAIEKLGYEVDYFCETPTGFFYTLCERLKINSFTQKHHEKHSLSIAEKCGNDYDVIFVIKANVLTEKAIKIIKSKNKKAKTVLYLWDSIERIDNYKNVSHCFDAIFSFDRVDSQKNSNITFKPLFYRSEYRKTEETKAVYDLFFVGWSHSDRAILLKNIASNLEKQQLKIKFLILVGKVSYHTSSAIRAIRNLTIKTPIGAKEAAQYCFKSNAVLDLAHPNQTGLTIRTIEVLFGAKRKLVTTNKDIANYDFYDEDNILIIDRNNLEIPKSFFEKAFNPYSKTFTDSFFIENWVKDFFDGTSV